MRSRCFNPNHPDYPNYGARGIRPCEAWDSFVNYYADVGDAPPGKSLDRVDNDRGYEPANWRWATRSEQARNRRPAKQKRRRADVTQVRAYADTLARASSRNIDQEIAQLTTRLQNDLAPEVALYTGSGQ
jgi:hypothetical protein